MTQVIFGNHAAVRVRSEDRDRIRKFYSEALGCALTRALDDKDDFRMGEAFHLSFLYTSGRGIPADQGVTYAAEKPLSDEECLKGIFLEIKADDVNAARERIVACGARVLPVPDSHLYFQAPGGQVFRLVGIDEDLSKYEGTSAGD